MSDVQTIDTQTGEILVGTFALTSSTIADLTGALAKAQADFPQIPRKKTAKIKTKTGGEYSYTYADLADVLDAVRKPLAANGLAITQPLVQLNGKLLLVTRLMHASGEWIESTMPLAAGGTPQETGAAITYARRYALTSLLGIATEDDTDAQGVAEKKSKKGTEAPSPAKQPAPIPQSQGGASAPISEQQRNAIYAIASRKGVKDDIKLMIRERYGCDMGELTGGRDGTASACIDYLQETSEEDLAAYAQKVLQAEAERAKAEAP